MTYQEICEQYDVGMYSDGTTVIRQPGKFQNEPAWTPYYWDQYLNGSSDEDVAGNLFFIVSQEDREEFPELTGVYGVILEERETGFVDSHRCKDQQEYDRCLKNCQEQESRDSGEVSGEE